MLNISIKNITYFLLLTFSVLAEARWITPEEAGVLTLLDRATVKINKKGKSEEIYEAKLKIINEQGRQNISSYKLYYNADSTKLKILEAYTIDKNKKYNVALDSIEDKPIASSASGFDQTHQILISFPKAEVGSEIYLKFSLKSFKTPLPNFYSNAWGPIDTGCTNDFKMKITSELPLYSEVNDPDNILKITQNKNNIDIELTRPVCQETLSGSEKGQIGLQKYTWVMFSTMDKWQEFGNKIAHKYETILNQPLPDMFLSILEEAKEETDEIKQLNLITTRINEKLRYMGNWKTIDGGFIPRNLSTIAQLQEADCKEFSTITAAILRRLGYKANVSIINRGEGKIPYINKIPNFSNFDHVVVKTTSPSSKTYWIDATNSISMAQGIFFDIADRPTLVLEETKSYFDRTPNVNYNNSSILLTENLNILDTKINYSGELLLKGEYASILTGAELFIPKKAIENNLYYLLSGEYLTDPNKKKLILPNLTSRIVQDLKFDFEYEDDQGLIKTNLNPALELQTNWAAQIIDYIPNQLSDLYIGPSHTLKKKLIFKNRKIDSIEKLNTKINSKWIDIEIKCSSNNNNSEVEFIVAYKANFITSEELQSNEYLALKQAIEKNIINIAVILNKE